MSNRREFLKSIAVAAASVGVAGRFTYDVLAQAVAGRRQISIGGKRIKVIDAHAHLSVPAVGAVVKGTPFERNGNAAPNQVIGPERIKAMDALGIDMAVLTQQGAWWYGVPDRELARAVVKTMNEGTAAVVKQYPDRFVGMAAFPMQFPDLAAEALEDGVKRLGLKGGGISAGFLADKEFSAPEFDVFWAKAQELGALLFMHPGGDTGAEAHLRGKGNLGNTVGNPLETAVTGASMVMAGVLERFPRLRVVLAHGGGALPAVRGRLRKAHGFQPEARSGQSSCRMKPASVIALYSSLRTSASAHR